MARQGAALRDTARGRAAGLALRYALLSGAGLMMMFEAKYAVHYAVCWLAMSHSDQQGGGNLQWEKNIGTERGQPTSKEAKRRAQST